MKVCCQGYRCLAQKITYALVMLEVKNLSKFYATYRKEPGLAGSLRALFHREKVEVVAVRPITFSVEKGEFVGLLGPNGAGKTTLLKMLTGLIAPSSGSATAFGEFDVSRRPHKYLERIGMVMGQRNQLNPDLPAMDSFRLAQAIYGVPDDEYNQRLSTLLELFDGHAIASRAVRKLSLGERMQMEMTLSLLHGPELLFLDEPTIGLDFVAAAKIRRFLSQINRLMEVTVILTSHYSKDIEELCRRVILINKGSCVYDGPLAKVDERIHGQREVEITFSDASSAGRARSALVCAGVAENEEGLETTTLPQPSVRFKSTPRALGAILLGIFSHVEASSIVDIRVAEAELESVFGEIYARGV
jgi:ABC-2 type transport system ATP-binding protein